MILRLINSAFYASVAVLGIAMISGNLYASMVAVFRPWSYAPALVWPWLWIGLAIGICGTVFFGASRMAAGKKLGLFPYALLIVLTVLAASARRAAPDPKRPHPSEAVVHLLARAEVAANEHFAKTGSYPSDPKVLTAQWPEQLRDMGYRKRGARRLKSRIDIREGALGAVFRPYPELRPGDLVFAVDASHRRYWLTAFVLDSSGRRVAATSAGRRTLQGSGRDGRPSSRHDPLFPEYPNKSSMQ